MQNQTAVTTTAVFDPNRVVILPDSHGLAIQQLLDTSPCWNTLTSLFGYARAKEIKESIDHQIACLPTELPTERIPEFEGVRS